MRSVSRGIFVLLGIALLLPSISTAQTPKQRTNLYIVTTYSTTLVATFASFQACRSAAETAWTGKSYIDGSATPFYVLPVCISIPIFQEWSHF
jgi:hypothetical protein